MNNYIVIMNEFMISAAVIAGPPLLIATVVGFTLSVFQAITSIQDQTLSQTAKIISITAALFFLSFLLVAPLYHSTLKLFETFHLVI